MALELIKKSCVRISVFINGTIIKQGSGVIVHSNDKFYVLTAYHCVGDNIIENIVIEKQKDYKSAFEKINIISKVEFDKTNDWILLEITYFDEDLKKIEIAKNFITDEKVKFCGYQNLVATEYRNWDAKVLDSAPPEFKITLLEKTFQQSGEDAITIAEGLSGSGVYIIKDGIVYLIGVLCSIIDEKGFNDDINCCCITNLIKHFAKCQDLSDVNYLDKWTENLENRSVEEEIEEWKKINVKQFDDINRKNKVLIDNIKDAETKTSKDVKNYLSLKYNIEFYEDKYPELFKKLRIIVSKYKNRVQSYYTRKVNGANEAKDVVIVLEENFKRELDSIFNSEMKIDIAEYQIIEWLLDCTLNFTPEEND